MTRDDKGRFVKGKSGNPGGRPAEHAAYRKRILTQLRKTVSRKDWEDIIARCVKQAKVGDRHARKWLADYCIGAPDLIDPVTTGMTLVAWMAQAEDRLNGVEGYPEEEE